MGLHRVLIITLLSLTLSSLAFAKGKELSGDDAEILDYIASHNPMVSTLEQTTKKTWGQYLKEGLRVGLKGSYTMSPTGESFTVGGEGGVGGVGATSTSTGKETTTGISFVFPLYPFQDPRERKEGIEAIAKARDEVTTKAIPLLLGLRQAQAKLKAVASLHDAHKGNVEYLKKRVDAGVDYQKNFFGDYLTYLKAKNELDDLNAQYASNMSALLSFVGPKDRAELKAMLEGKEPGEDEDKKKDEEPEPLPKQEEEINKDLTNP
jgi:hypothetical protein